MIEGKTILDACCGSRMFWFDKKNPNVLFADIRNEAHILCDGRELDINPDIVCDFRKMPFPDNTFQMVVFDPPHFTKLGETSWMAKKYGKLIDGWEEHINAGINECMRVAKPGGTVIFKWNERQIPIKKILEVISYEPLFGHTTKAGGHTIWMAFMKGICTK